MAKMSQKLDFRVLIVGGSVAGLTLANSLSRAGIDFLVLEAQENIEAPVGASIALSSNGAMILDQMGIFDDILELQQLVPSLYTWLHDGTFLSKMDTLKELQIRHNYPMIWLERQQLLRILFKHLPEKENVLLGKRVVAVDSFEADVVAYCDDGTSYSGNMIAGADGVHSTVRTEMWRHMDTCMPGNVLEKDRTAMVSEYSCVFGISSATLGINPGEAHRTWGEGFSFLVTVGKESQVFWQLYSKMGGTYRPPNIPRFTKKDLDAHLRRYLEAHVTQNVQFSALYQNIVSCSYVPMEEANYDHWTWGLFACLGDSIHKTTPNLGQGAGLAIENAASLANHTVSMLKANGTKPVRAEISAWLETWASGNKRRTRLICLAGNMLTRLETFATLKDKLVALYVTPYLGDLFADLVSEAVSGAMCLNFLPVPESFLNSSTPKISCVQAMKHCDEKQKMALKVCYGSGESDKVSRAKEIFDQLDLIKLFEDWDKEMLTKLETMIQKKSRMQA